jgi:type III restriction enzyme
MMTNEFFEKPIVNSPYEHPGRHWELDEQGQPTQQIIISRRSAEFIMPIPNPKSVRDLRSNSLNLIKTDELGLSSAA